MVSLRENPPEREEIVNAMAKEIIDRYNRGISSLMENKPELVRIAIQLGVNPQEAAAMMEEKFKDLRYPGDITYEAASFRKAKVIAGALYDSGIKTLSETTGTAINKLALLNQGDLAKKLAAMNDPSAGLTVVEIDGRTLPVSSREARDHFKKIKEWSEFIDIRLLDALKSATPEPPPGLEKGVKIIYAPGQEGGDAFSPSALPAILRKLTTPTRMG